MNYISITYSLNYTIKGQPEYYKVTECRKVFNCRTGRLLKKCYNNGSIGYWFGKQFIPIKKLRLQKINPYNLPF
jgi:hypothetical protein